MAYLDEATFRDLFGSDLVDGYFGRESGSSAVEVSRAVEAALELAQDRVFASVVAAGHKDKTPASYSTIASVPGVIRMATYVAMQEMAYRRRGLSPADFLSPDEMDIFRQIRDGEIEIPGTDVDDTTRAVGGQTYTEKGLSDSSSSRYHGRVFGRKQMAGNY